MIHWLKAFFRRAHAYRPCGDKCPACGSRNTYIDDPTGIHWCGDCDNEW